MAKDSNGNYVPNVPFGLHYGLWVMIKLIIHQLDGHIVQKLMLWNGLPQNHLLGGGSGYETQANVAYHWNGADGLGYTHWSDSQYYNFSNPYTQFHKWRVDIYRYDDGVNTNKIEMFMNDNYISGSRFI